MSNLNTYTDQKQTELFNKTGTFFAFGNEQFEEAKKEGVKYTSCGAGMICPTKNVKELIKGLDKIQKEGIKQDIEVNGIERIIVRELYNYESFYTYEMDEAMSVLKKYGVTEEQVSKEFYKEVEKNGHKH
jgi:hypothetical protein